MSAKRAFLGGVGRKSQAEEREMRIPSGPSAPGKVAEEEQGNSTEKQACEGSNNQSLVEEV